MKYTVSGEVYDVKLADMPSQTKGSNSQYVSISWRLPASVKLSRTFSVAGSDMDWNISISNGSRQEVEITDLMVRIPIGAETNRCLPRTILPSTYS